MRWGKKRKPLFRHLKCSVTSDLPSEIAFKPSAFSLTRDVVRPCTLRPIVTCACSECSMLGSKSGQKVWDWMYSIILSKFLQHVSSVNKKHIGIHACIRYYRVLSVCVHLYMFGESKWAANWLIGIGSAWHLHLLWTGGLCQSLPTFQHIPTTSSKSTNQEWVAPAWALSLQGPGSKLRRSKYWSSQRHSGSVCDVFWGWTLRVSLPSLPAFLCHGTSWLKLTKDASSTEKLSGLLNTFIELGHHGLENLTFWGFKTQTRWVSV